jgi:hypothetical protein
MSQLCFRQIHLDFHTSPDIPGIGADFDPETFARTLADAGVNSVTCFARCHHGLIYFDTKLHPERIHPHLARPNLLAEQIEACHRHGIRVPIYTTVQWDAFSADAHREWLCIDDQGREFGTKPLEPGFYRNLDVFHPGYRQFLFDHVADVLESLPVDGLFFDIVQVRPSLAPHWIAAMEAAGVRVEDAAARHAYAQTVIYDWEREMTAFVRARNPDCTIFYNSGHVGPRHRPTVDAYTHYELESLPSGGWGYLHFPQAMRYARTLGNDCMGMTGKFHTSWGDFGSYKNPAALQFECFHMLALGAKCSIGDQLHPGGRIDAATYDLVGGVYREIARKEPWCVGANPVSDVAVMTTEEFVRPDSPHGDRNQNNVLGAVRLLQELAVSFDIVDSHTRLDGYRLLILPDDVPLDVALATRIDAFLDRGGAVLASYRSGLGADGAFASKNFGLTCVGDAPYSPDFFVPGGGLGEGLPAVGHAMYRRGMQVEHLPGCEVLSRVELPYFNRTWRHYCSHKHTPSSGEIGYPAATRYGSLIYLAHPVFRQYFDNAPQWVKALVRDAIRQLLPDPVLEVRGPSSLIATVLRQEAEQRHIVHLLHYVPERRGQEFDTIEDIFPVHDIGVTLRIPGAVTAVTLVPDGDPLTFTHTGGMVSFTVPVVHGHSMIAVS